MLFAYYFEEDQTPGSTCSRSGRTRDEQARFCEGCKMTIALQGGTCRSEDEPLCGGTLLG